MIKIKWFSRTAERAEGGTWKSKDKSFENLLNLIAVPEKVMGYYPDIQEGIIKIVQDEYKGVEIVEFTQNKNREYPKDAVF